MSRSTLPTALLFLGSLSLSITPAAAQCPAFGQDTTCGAIITIIQTGNTPCPSTGCATVTFTGQGPYDGADDTLVGVVNNSNLPITSIVLSSGAGAFGFDGDGVDTFGAPGNSRDGSGYGGPNAYFTNVTSTSATVNFITPIPPNGGTSYFSLENSLGAATACSTIINNSVPKPPGGGLTINATFTPKNGLTIAQAASLCGFTGFDWQQTVTHLPDPSPFCENPTLSLSSVFSNPQPFCNEGAFSLPPYPIHLTSRSTPFNDPPPSGYTYGFFNSFPFYYPSATVASDEASGTPTLCITKNGSTCLTYDINTSNTTLNFYDFPKDPCFSGGGAVGKAACGNTSVPAGSNPYVGFTLHLAGIQSDGSAKDLGIGFTWKSTYNGGSSGSVSTGTTDVPDPNAGGTGGITITSYGPTTSYQYPTSFGVTGINGNTVASQSSQPSTLLPGYQVTVLASGLTYSRLTQTFSATLSIVNLTNAAISGPFQIVLDSLTPGVTLANASGTFGGWPYITVPATASLAAGQAATVNVVFKNPSNAIINFAPVSYSGSFN
jgi:hypothetical protein